MRNRPLLNARLRIALCVLFFFAVITAALLRRPAPTKPLPASSTVVLLLAPGSSLADWSDREKTPALAKLIDVCPHGVFPTRTDEAPETVEAPLDAAARMIATGDRTPPHLPPTLAEILEKSGVTVVTLANQDNAARSIAGFSRPDPLTVDEPRWKTPEPSFPDGLVTDPDAFASAVAEASRPTELQPTPLAIDGDNARRLVIASFDDIYRADQYAPLALPAATLAQRSQALGRLDRVIYALVSRDGPSRLSGAVTLLLVSPVQSSAVLQRNERLGPVLIVTRGSSEAQGGLLTSPSTRATPGLLAGTDLAATVAAALGLPPARQHIGEGRAARIVADDGRLPARIRAWDTQAGQQKLLIYVPWILAVALFGATWAASSELRIAASAGAAAAFYPAALSIASLIAPPEWTASAIYLIAAAPCVALLASAGMPRLRGQATRYVLGYLASATVLILSLDVLAGGAILARTPLSFSPMEAARFYGIGNEAAGALIGAAILVAGEFLNDLETDLSSFVLFAVAVCMMIALPQLGAKAGSLIGALAGFGSFYLFRRSTSKRGRPSMAATVAVFAFIIVLVAAFVMFEAIRGAEARTHVGEALAAAHRHGFGALVAIARRKLEMDLHLLVTSPWSALLATEVLVSVYLWRRNRLRWSATSRATMISFLSAGGALLLFNDAGVVGAATCLLFAVAFGLLPVHSSRKSTN